MPERQKRSNHQHSIHIAPTFRWLENAHILLWLIKDTCWAMEWKQGGVFMILPTISVAFFLLWKSRKIRAELYHNLAVCFWIMANSTWMIGEFIEVDFRPFAAGLFGFGLSALAIYYTFFFKKDKQTYTVR